MECQEVCQAEAFREQVDRAASPALAERVVMMDQLLKRLIEGLSVRCASLLFMTCMLLSRHTDIDLGSLWRHHGSEANEL